MKLFPPSHSFSRVPEPEAQRENKSNRPSYGLLKKSALLSAICLGCAGTPPPAPPKPPPPVLSRPAPGPKVQTQDGNEGTLLNKTGMDLEEQGKVEEALLFYRRALAIDEKTLGPEHPHVARDLNNIGSALEEQGKLDEALSHYRRALAIDEKVFGPEHSTVGIDLNNIGSAEQAQGKLDEALSHYRRALAIAQKALGAKHPTVATRINNIGSALKAQGKLDEALEHFWKALSIDEQEHGHEHPRVARDLNNIASALKAQGKLDEALEQFRKALAISEKTQGLEHPSTGLIRENLAFALAQRSGWNPNLHHRGAVVLHCPAQDCFGLEVGDWIQSYGAASILNIAQLTELMRKSGPEQKIILRLWRAGKKQTLLVPGGLLNIAMQ